MFLKIRHKKEGVGKTQKGFSDKYFLDKDFLDKEIIREYRQKQNPDILEPLFESYMHLVFGICMKYLKNTEDAEDATMEILEKLMDDLIKHEVDNFPAWLHSLSRNYCLMKLRSKKHIFIGENEDAGRKILNNLVESDPDLHLYNEREAELSQLEDALAQLNKEQGQCLSLFYLSGKSYQEVAKETGFSIKQVKSHIQNGKRKLKINLISITNGNSSR